MLTTEQLLIKRYKCIAPIPFQPAKDMYKVGDIFTDDGKTAVRNQHGDPVFAIQWEDYPHLFQPLPWWSDRQISEMPEFVKLNPETTIGGDKVFNVLEAQLFDDGAIGLRVDDKELSIFPFTNVKHFIPATLADYEQYNQQKEGMKCQ